MTAKEFVESYDKGARDFRDANLSGADLREADLRRAKGIQVYGPAPSSGRMVYVIDNSTVYAGCFKGTPNELKERAISEGKQWYIKLADFLTS